eukprot:TRINITY_DN43216_c0_g1_i1.p1 TRINITY_DN43216_c0_g1~~TRINITY_DN43216_c0_g1_i1.p1  ORF type:complete len:644 (-),score=98.32 TRINITY_DN43216_c0_g1_i1:229-2076(-)
MMSDIQIIALASKSRISKSRYNWMILGGFLTCAFLLLFGILQIREFRSIGQGEGLLLQKAAVESNRFLVLLAWYVVIVLGFGNVVAAPVGFIGIVFRKTPPVMGVTVWLLSRVVLGAFVTINTVVYDTAGLGWAWTLLVVATPWLVMDLFLAYFGIQLLLAIALSMTSQGCISSVERARRVARECGAPACDRGHLVASLLQDPVSRRLLEVAGANVSQMEGRMAFAIACAARSEEADSAAPSRGQPRKFITDAMNLHNLPFAFDLKATLCDAAMLQQNAGDELLTTDHILLAMCSGGQLSINAPAVPARGVAAERLSYAVDAHVFRHRLRANRCPSKAGGPADVDAGATVFGCLPLEELVIVWGVVRCVGFLVAALFFLASIVFEMITSMEFRFLGGSVERLLGALFAVVGAIVSWGAVQGIRGHRLARQCVEEAARDHGVGSGAGLGEAFEVVRGETEASRWSHRMKTGANVLWLLVMWSVLELVADVPVLGMAAFRANLCGSYINGQVAISRLGFWFSSPVPMHCSHEEKFIIVGVILWQVMKLLLCRAVFLLWHEYMHGWTATDLRGGAYLEPMSILPESVIRILAGLPRFPSRTNMALYFATGGEAKPLLT